MDFVNFREATMKCTLARLFKCVTLMVQTSVARNTFWGTADPHKVIGNEIYFTAEVPFYCSERLIVIVIEQFYHLPHF